MVSRFFCLVVLILNSWACGSKSLSSSAAKGLDTENSNIASPHLALSSVKDLKVLPNTHIPKGILMSYMGANYNHVKSMYLSIQEINKKDQLSGLEGYYQEITLLVAVERESDFQNLKDKLYRDGVISKQDRNQKMSDLQSAPGLLTRGDLWMQDWGEFVAIKPRDEQSWRYGVMDVGRGRGIEPKVLSDIFDISFLRVSTGVSISKGNYGGNLEATPAGRLYFGNSLKDQGMRDHLLNRNQDAIELESDWLNVGHVDEYITVISSPKTSCGNAIAVADPIRALNIYLQNPNELQSVSELRTIPNSSDWNILLKSGVNKLGDFDLADFKDDVLNTSSYNQLSKSGKYIALNITVAKIIERNVQKLKSEMTCPVIDVARLPQFYGGSKSTKNGKDYVKKALSTLQNTVNMVVLRNHLVVPMPTRSNGSPVIKSFEKDIIQQLSKHVDKDDIHFIDIGYYHDLWGGVHCATNVVRELDMVFRN